VGGIRGCSVSAPNVGVGGTSRAIPLSVVDNINNLICATATGGTGSGPRARVSGNSSILGNWRTIFSCLWPAEALTAMIAPTGQIRSRSDTYNLATMSNYHIRVRFRIHRNWFLDHEASDFDVGASSRGDNYALSALDGASIKEAQWLVLKSTGKGFSTKDEAVHAGRRAKNAIAWSSA